MVNLPVPPRGSYKAFLWDYDNLLTRSDEECCFSLSEREIQILLANIDTIAWATRYKPTHTDIDINLLKKWQGNLARKLMSGCCPDDNELHRFSSDGIYQTSNDGGETWLDDPLNDPRNDGVLAPPLTGAGSAEQQCAAADNVKGQFEVYRDQMIALLTAGTTATAIIAGILAFIGAIAGVSGVGIGLSVLMLGLAHELLSLTPESVEEQIDETALETFKCILFCNMQSNGQFTYQNWMDILSRITGEFTGFPEAFFYQTVAGMGYIGLSNAGTIGAATASDCDDCDCGLQLVALAGVIADPGTITKIASNVWDLTGTFRPIGGGATDDTYTVYVQSDPNVCWQITDITLISGAFNGSTSGSNCPGFEWNEWGVGYHLDLTGDLNFIVDKSINWVGIRSESPIKVRVTIEECP